MKIERRCRITGVDNPIHLVASHCKPWRDSTNEERLNGENGLLLTRSIDHLFDSGSIGFGDSDRLVISPVAHRPSLERMGVNTRSAVNVGGFTEGQRRYLDFRRNSVLLSAVRYAAEWLPKSECGHPQRVSCFGMSAVWKWLLECGLMYLHSGMFQTGSGEVRYSLTHGCDCPRSSPSRRARCWLYSALALVARS